VQNIRMALEYSSLPLNDPVVGYFSNYGRVDAWSALRLLPSLNPWYPTSPTIHWISPHRLPATGWLVTIFGRGFGWDANTGAVLLQSRQLVALSTRPVPRPQPVLRVLEWSDSRIVVQVPNGAASGWLQVRVRGWLTVDPSSLAFATAPSDVGIVGRYGQGASLSGGYAELLEADGKALVARPRTDNSKTIELKLLVRGLDKNSVSSISAEYLRQYVGVGDSVVESVQLYDFSTGSYPYGVWVEVFNASASAHAGETLRFSLPAPASRWVSYEGDLFVKIVVNTGNADARLLIDRLWFLWQ
jgi:hypothetical protein